MEPESEVPNRQEKKKVRVDLSNPESYPLASSHRHLYVTWKNVNFHEWVNTDLFLQVGLRVYVNYKKTVLLPENTAQGEDA